MKYYWKMRDGKLIDVDQMSETHLRNALKMVLRNSQRKVAIRKPIGNIEANFFDAQNNEYLEDEFINQFYGAWNTYLPTTSELKPFKAGVSTLRQWPTLQSPNYYSRKTTITENSK